MTVTGRKENHHMRRFLRLATYVVAVIAVTALADGCGSKESTKGPTGSISNRWDAVANGKAKTISGITTPDNKTIVFHLTKATGDFNLRMSMPATAPIPHEVADCFEGKPGDYGRDVVSSGPYMIQGSDAV